MSFFGGRSAPAAMAGRGLGGAPFYATAGSTGVDFGTVRDQQAVPAAPTFQPFKFEPKRARIDWRLLHGIDIHAMVRDVDLDTLERIVNIVAYGDIEAEDTRHLTELNFIKIFRLAQMMIEYLLYVQECLQNSNSWLQQDRGSMDKYVQAARLRIRELDANLKMTKRELRRARKTVKTYEMLAVLNDGKLAGATPAVAAAAPAAAAAPGAPANSGNSMASAVEALLRKEMALLAERLGRATVECQQLRGERDEMYSAIKDIDVAVKARGDQPGGKLSMEALAAMQSMHDQLNRAASEYAKLHKQKEELTGELERANVDRRQLQEEKGKLLVEIAARPSPRGSDPSGGTGSGGSMMMMMQGSRAASGDVGGDNLGGMLLEAERQKEAMGEQLEAQRAEIAQLQKQLMKAMKATALGGAPDEPQAPGQAQLRGALKDAEGAKAQLERELAELRKLYNDDVRQLQEELELTQAKAVDSDRKLAQLRSTSSTSLLAGEKPGEGTARMAVRPAGVGGLVRVVEERPGQLDDEQWQPGGQGSKDRLAEYEAMNERLNQQVAQLKLERSALTGDMERLRAAQADGQGGGALPQQQGEQGMAREWKVEEIERLRGEVAQARARCVELEGVVADRDVQVEKLRGFIRELQAQLAQANAQLDSRPADPTLGRVKQQVHEYERGLGAVVGGAPIAVAPVVPPPSHVKVESFSFIPESAVPGPAGGAQQPPTPQAMLMQPPQAPPPSPQQLAQQAAQAQSPVKNKWLQRVPRPAAADSPVLRHNILARVAGMRPEQLEMMLGEEIRVITENPFEFEDDDEATFRALLPHEVAERKGVLSAKQHDLQDLEVARQLYTEQLLTVTDDELAQYAIDPRADSLPDKDYAAAMLELAARRNAILERHPREVQERAERLRDALLTHLELVKRNTQQEVLAAQQRGLQAEQQQQPAQAAVTQLQVVTAAAPPAPSQPAVSLAAAAAAAPQPMPGAGGGQQPPASKRSLASTFNETGGNDVSARGPGLGAGKLPLPVMPATTAGAGAGAVGAAGGSGQSFKSLASSTATSSSAQLQQVPLQPVQVQQPGQAAAGSGATPADPRALPSGSGPGASGPPSPLSRSIARAGSTSASQGGILNASANASVASSAARVPIMRVGGASGQRRSSGGGTVLTLAAPGGSGGGAGAAAGAAGVHPFNMSSRSKYQESDFDDDEEAPLPLPKAIARVTKEDDEYALTEDEETLQDDGLIESDDDEASPAGPGPKVIVRTGSPSHVPPPAAAPSRLGQGQPQPLRTTGSAGVSRGWATEEPLQPAASAPAASGQQQRYSTSTPTIAEDAPAPGPDMESSIRSFNNAAMSESLPRRPGAWGSPSATMRKASASASASQKAVGAAASVVSGTGAKEQLNATATRSVLNETIQSFGAPSGAGDEIQKLDDTSLQSFGDSIRPSRPTGAGAGARNSVFNNNFGGPPSPQRQISHGRRSNSGSGAAAGAAPAGQPAPTRVLDRRRDSFDTDITDIDYL